MTCLWRYSGREKGCKGRWGERGRGERVKGRRGSYSPFVTSAL
jgi:hypothetical protein